MVSLKEFTEETGRKVFFKKNYRCGVVLAAFAKKYYDVDFNVNNDFYYVKWQDGYKEWYLKKDLIFIDEFVGKKVRFVNKNVEPKRAWCFPSVGTIGKVCYIKEDGNILVQWPRGTTSGDDAWYCLYTAVEVIEEGEGQKKEYTDEEIWKFLKPKMKQHMNRCSYDIDNLSQEIKDMIVSAYRSGYGRASKGRPFKIGDKK